MTPPQLTGDTPVVYIFHPAQVGLEKRSGTNLVLPSFTTSIAGLASGAILTNHCAGVIGSTVVAAAVAGAYVVLVVLNLDQPAAFPQGSFTTALRHSVAVHAPRNLPPFALTVASLVEHEESARGHGADPSRSRSGRGTA